MTPQCGPGLLGVVGSTFFNIRNKEYKNMAERIEAYERRFGYLAIQKGFVNAQQLVDALDTQISEEVRKRKHRPIGQILIDLNYMTLKQIEEVLAEQIKE